MHCDIVATFLQGVRAVSKGTLVRIQVRSTFSSVFGMLFSAFAGVSKRLLSEQSGSENASNLHIEQENERVVENGYWLRE
jgi:hypothetical protein